MKPLGLPEGSVRAIILLALVAAILIPVIVFDSDSTDIPANIEKFLTGVLIALISMIRDYVTERKNNSDAESKAGSTAS